MGHGSLAIGNFGKIANHCPTFPSVGVNGIDPPDSISHLWEGGAREPWGANEDAKVSKPLSAPGRGLGRGQTHDIRPYR
jgi:hypothetical protein